MGKRFKCAYCNYQSDSYRDMDKHKETAHRGEVKKPKDQSRLA